MNSEYYCGLPQNQWDYLAEQAEEILRDQEYGQHILGLYPAGPRIYGIESSSPSLLCLYVDTVDSLIDPSKNHKKLITEQVGNSDSKIYFIELYAWAKWFFQSLTTVSREPLLPILPIVQDIFYEDESISSIISTGKDILSMLGPCRADEGDYPSLAARAQAIFGLRNTFNPCINKEHGIVIGLDELGVVVSPHLIDLDKCIVDTYLKHPCRRPSHVNRSLEEMEKEYIRMLYDLLPETNYDKAYKLWRSLGKEISNLYRYQL